MRALFALTFLLYASPVAADCRASASSSFSVSVTLSPLSGGTCVNDVSVYEGANCTGTRQWSTALGCNEARRMVVSDDGTLISLLASRASRRDWEIVRIFRRAGDHVEVRAVRLRDLPGLPAETTRPRLELDASNLRVIEPPLSIGVASLLDLGARAGARRLHTESQ